MFLTLFFYNMYIVKYTLVRLLNEYRGNISISVLFHQFFGGKLPLFFLILKEIYSNSFRSNCVYEIGTDTEMRFSFGIHCIHKHISMTY